MLWGRDGYSEQAPVGPGGGHFKGHFSEDQQAPTLAAVMTEAVCRVIAQPFEGQTNLGPTLGPNLCDPGLVA